MKRFILAMLLVAGFVAAQTYRAVVVDIEKPLPWENIAIGTLPPDRLEIPDAVTIPTNATYTISYTNGQFTSYSFGAGTNDLTITLEGPGAGYRSWHEVYWESGYTNRPVTWANPAGALTWINDEPTTSEAQIMFIWTGTNAAAINTTVTQ